MRIWGLRSPLRPTYQKYSASWLFKILLIGFPRHVLAQTYVKQRNWIADYHYMYINVLNNTWNEFYFVIDKKNWKYM